MLRNRLALTVQNRKTTRRALFAVSLSHTHTFGPALYYEVEPPKIPYLVACFLAGMLDYVMRSTKSGFDYDLF